MPVNTLVDESVQYCTTGDVERYIRNKSFDATSDPTESEVQEMILGASERVDDFTRRAWRERRVSDRQEAVEMTHELRSSFQRKRRASTSRGFLRPIERWVEVYLPHMHVLDIDAGESDQILILEPEDTTDITADGGSRSEDSEWYLDNRKGVLYIDATNYRVGPVRGSGMIRDPKVRVSYRYGITSDDTDGNNVPDDLPQDIRTATAKMVASDLIVSDTYGAALASGPENTPDQTTAAERLRTQAEETLADYKDTRVML